MDIWFIAFLFAYASLLILAYVAYISKIVKRIMHGRNYLSYHIIDTGEHGEHVFVDGVNEVGGAKRMYQNGCDFHGCVYYEYKNAEPIKVKQDIDSYRYYCDTKNFDTNHRNDILQTLFILNTKQLIIGVIIIGIIVTVVGILINYYVVSSAHNDLSNAIATLHNTTTASQPPGVTTVGGP